MAGQEPEIMRGDEIDTATASRERDEKKGMSDGEAKQRPEYGRDWALLGVLFTSANGPLHSFSGHCVAFLIPRPYIYEIHGI